MPKILIVDDDPDMRQAIQAGLRRASLQMVTAADGNQALQAAMREKPDLILMDVMMPPPNGMEVCRQLKAQMEGFTPIVLMTARGDLDNKLKGFQHGADDFLVKPFAIEELTSRVKSMLRIKALHDDMRRASLTDPLTGIFNRRGLENRLAREFQKAERNGTPFSCLFIDIDRMKRINDEHGHPAGDQALLHVVQTVKNHLRADDSFARHGGDEFLALFPGLPLIKAKSLAERIRQTLDEHPVLFSGKNLEVTVSIGVAMLPLPGVDDVAAFLRLLDDALYQAKRNGRNEVYTVDMRGGVDIKPASTSPAK